MKGHEHSKSLRSARILKKKEEDEQQEGKNEAEADEI